MVLFQNCVWQSRSPTRMAATVQLRCYWKQLWSRWAIYRLLGASGLCMILFINNTKNTFYETKVLKTKHVLFLKYIYNALLNSYRTFGPVSLRNLLVQHEIYRSRSIGPVPISTLYINTKYYSSYCFWFIFCC